MNHGLMIPRVFQLFIGMIFSALDRTGNVPEWNLKVVSLSVQILSDVVCRNYFFPQSCHQFAHSCSPCVTENWLILWQFLLFTASPLIDRLNISVSLYLYLVSMSRSLFKLSVGDSQYLITVAKHSVIFYSILYLHSFSSAHNQMPIVAKIRSPSGSGIDYGVCNHVARWLGNILTHRTSLPIEQKITTDCHGPVRITPVSKGTTQVPLSKRVSLVVPTSAGLKLLVNFTRSSNIPCYPRWHPSAVLQEESLYTRCKSFHGPFCLRVFNTKTKYMYRAFLDYSLAFDSMTQPVLTGKL